MSNIDTRSPFFPKSRTAQAETARKTQELEQSLRSKNERTQDINSRTSGDAKVSIPEGVKEFSRIKKAVDAAPEVDNSEKIARLRAQIQEGSYEVDYDALADKMLTSEF